MHNNILHYIPKELDFKNAELPLKLNPHSKIEKIRLKRSFDAYNVCVVLGDEKAGNNSDFRDQSDA